MLLRFLVTCLFVLRVLGQNSVRTFSWKFRPDFFSSKLPVCFQFPIIVFPLNATAGNFSGVPPYYMMAFPEGGQPITTFIGASNDSLSWAPSHPVGTKLILQLMDSQGNTGGSAPTVLQVGENTQPGSDNCLAPPPPNDFTISSNITQDGKSTLATCQPWRLNIDGGTPPYTVVLDAENSPVLTNITVPGSDNAVVYINRADPDIVLFAGVVDVTGRWANGTQFVQTTGSSDYDCPGLNTVTTSQDELNQEDAQRKAAQAAQRRRSIIIGVVVSMVLLLLIVGGLGTLCYIRRKKTKQLEETAQDVAPRQFIGTGSPGQVLSIGSFMSSTTTTPSPGKSGFSSDVHRLPYAFEPFSYTDSVSAAADSANTSSATGQSPSGANLRSRPSFANFPATSVRRSKGQEAAQSAMSESSQSSIPPGAGRPIWPVRSGSLQDHRLTATESELIFQHRDAGQVSVRELPPPYIAPPDVQTPGAAETQPRT